MTDAGSQRAASLPEEEPVEGSDEIEVDATIGSDTFEPNYTPDDPINPDPSEPDYKPSKHEPINLDYEPDEDEEEIATSPKILPPLPTLLHRSYRSCLTSTRVKNTPRKTTTIPTRKRLASPRTSPHPTKMRCSNYAWMPQIRGL
ncbi:unnamed protein product [Lactuca virosa]|uniref:Uncharacterized protein n=1 Tax=Lactuca virosa TaxID=75947 RepID=A0AAU9MUI6_9ASTR|nr:unnamed protein product [Lactuca virosa]